MTAPCLPARPRAPGPRSPHALHRRAEGGLAALAMASLAMAVALFAFALPAHATLAGADLSAQARVLLDAQALDIPGDVEITVGEPDPRLSLADCARAEPFVPPNARLWGRTQIGVRCVEGARWTAYIPVTVRVFAPAPVAARPIARGETLGRGDVRLERLEITQWPPGELAPPEQVDGRVATRAIAAAEPLRRGLLRQPPAVVPGDLVKVVIETGSFSVTAEGTALTQAAPGDGVQVSLPGGKTVWGKARPGKVVQLP